MRREGKWGSIILGFLSTLVGRFLAGRRVLLKTVCFSGGLLPLCKH